MLLQLSLLRHSCDSPPWSAEREIKPRQGLQHSSLLTSSLFPMFVHPVAPATASLLERLLELDPYLKALV